MQIYGKTITLIPAIGAEAAETQVRMDKYGGMDVIPRLDAQEANAHEGSLYVARAAPAAGGTGIAMGIQTTFSDTAHVPVCLQNGNAAGGKTLIPQYIKGRVTAAGSTTTSSEAAIEVDSTSRYSSGGSVLSGLPTNPSASSPATAAVLHVGDVTAAAAGAGRAWIFQKLIRKAAAPAWIVNDEIYFVFGALGAGEQAYQKFANPMDTQADPGTTFVFACAAVALPPTATLLLHIANVANATTAPSFEWEVCWTER